MTALEQSESTRLGELEDVIERGQQTFVDVGNALLEIRDRRLYRASHGTFKAYCEDRWGFSRSRGYRLIRAAQLADVSPMGDISNERQARALLEPSKQDPFQRFMALAFGLDPELPLPPSVQAVADWAAEQPLTVEEATDAAESLEQKLHVTEYYMQHEPVLEWELVGSYLLRKAILETTGASIETVRAVLDTGQKMF